MTTPTSAVTDAPAALVRAQAFRAAAELFRDCYVEPDVHDLLTVADWLLTGTADLALAFSDQAARNYGDRSVGSPDAATWSPSYDDIA